MSGGRRAAVLGGLAIVLGSLAASDVSGREAALRRGLGPVVPVVVARADIAAGAPIRAAALAVRRAPVALRAGAEPSATRRRSSAGAPASPIPGGHRPAAGAAGGRRGRGRRRPRPVRASGSRGSSPSARRASSRPGTLTDVLITRDGPGGAARTRLALRGAEVVASAPAPRAPEGDQAGLPRAALALRVTLRQAIALVEAQNGARELRALPRPGTSALR